MLLSITRPLTLKRRLQHKMFSCDYCETFQNTNFEGHLRTFLPFEVVYKNFVNKQLWECIIWYTGKLAQLIYFLTAIAFWLMKYLLRFDGNNLSVLAKNFTLCSIYCSNQPLWKNHDIASINFNYSIIDEPNQAKMSRKIMGCQDYSLKIALGMRYSKVPN